MDIMQILLGIGLLLAGKRIFWLFTGGVGFVYGFSAAAQLFPGQPDWVAIAAAFGAGVLGAIAAFWLQRLAVCVAGFLSGGYIALAFFGSGVLTTASAAPFVIGGFIGLMILLIFFDLALIALSSLVGAAVITDNLNISQAAFYALFAALAVTGIAVQLSSRNGKEKKREKGD